MVNRNHLINESITVEGEIGDGTDRKGDSNENNTCVKQTPKPEVNKKSFNVFEIFEEVKNRKQQHHHHQKTSEDEKYLKKIDSSLKKSIWQKFSDLQLFKRKPDGNYDDNDDKNSAETKFNASSSGGGDQVITALQQQSPQLKQPPPFQSPLSTPPPPLAEPPKNEPWCGITTKALKQKQRNKSENQDDINRKLWHISFKPSKKKVKQHGDVSLDNQSKKTKKRELKKLKCTLN
ncbi:hypothetical protein O3M35_011104 [Rhynocoris fuscipes]|uniref:Uncharacterized protein n=1 Tax=Rhynocoris fuscipes TaxID=488301 RepID=A0AAW1CVC9_9HEMI